MSSCSDHSRAGNSRLSLFPSRLDRDRYPGNTSSHTSDPFTGDNFGAPTAPLGSSRYLEDNCTASHYQRVLDRGQGREEDAVDIDEFDRQLLGRSTAGHRRYLLSWDSPYLPPSSSESASHTRPRVLEDASHHFQPFFHQTNSYRPPQFVSNPINPNQLNENISTFQTSFDPDVFHTGSVYESSGRVLTPVRSGPQASPITPSIHSAVSSLGRSSPSARLFVQRPQTRLSRKDPVELQSSGRDRLALDHAPDDNTLVVAGTTLICPRQALPDKCRSIFPYEVFNVVQSKCFPLVYGSIDNVVISAPTGSGKTAVLELAICKLITIPGGGNFKIVYQAPTKSLCSERARDWENKFRHLNLRCVALTGDTSHVEAKRVGSASIIVTTPEKWDSITRKWSDHRKLLEMVRLVLIDEVHILRDIRGATLEAVVSRMKTIGANVRFVALSATIPNLADVATWIGRNHANQNDPAMSISFGEEVRPVKLRKHVYGYDHPGNDFIFDRSINSKLNMLLKQHAEGKPIMVFCFTRKSCEQTARKLAEWWTTLGTEDKPWQPPTESVPVINKDLKDIVCYGVSFHHAGLDVQDKACIERSFLSGQLHVICCTSTLAVGVNLPCHTVVLKGTTGYTNDGPEEYSDLEVMQMLGRAGRPQFDRSAVAIIMTKKGNVDRYERMISGQEVLESKLHLNLVEHINSEVGLGTILDLPTANRWIAGTFLSVRMRQSPGQYHAEVDVGQEQIISPDERIRAWCERDLELLQKHRLITTDTPFRCTEYGLAMSKYMVHFETMRVLLDIPTSVDVEQLLIALSKSLEFKNLRFKPQEKSMLRTVNKSVRYPVKELVGDLWHKVYLIVQIHLSGLELPDEKDTNMIRKQLAVEKRLIFDRMNRLVRCVIDCKVFDGDSLGVKSGLNLARALAANSWEAHPAQLQQVPGIGPVSMRKLVSHNVRSISDMIVQGFDDIERILRKNPPYGKNILKQLDAFPRLSMNARVTRTAAGRMYERTKESVSIIVDIQLMYQNRDVPIWNSKIPAVTLLLETTDGRIVSFWRSNIKKIPGTNGLQLKFPARLNHPDENICCYFSCEEIVGTEVCEVLRPNLPISAFEGLSKRRGSPLYVQKNNSQDEFDDEDLADEDMLTVLNTSDTSTDLSSSRLTGQPLVSDMDFQDIEEILGETDGKSVVLDDQDWAPIRLENGKWMCNHRCRGGELTKYGRPCTHRCCREGMDKPRPPPRKKKGDSSGKSVTRRDEGKQPASIQQSRIRNELTRPKSSGASQRHRETKGNESLAVSPSADSFTSKPNLKRNKSSMSLTTKSDNHAKKKCRSDARQSDWGENVELIDLCNVSEAETNLPIQASKQNGDTKERETHRLNGLYNHAQSQTIAPFRLAKSKLTTESDFDASFGSFTHDSDVLEERDDLHVLSELIGPPKEMQELYAAWKSVGDMTLSRGAVETYKESKDSGQESRLSFTTSSEFEKAQGRFDLGLQDVEICQQLPLEADGSRQRTSDFDPAPHASPRISTLHQRTSGYCAETSIGPNEITLPLQPKTVSLNTVFANAPRPSTPLPSLLKNDPAWVAEFDPELINEFRPYVQFVEFPNE